MAYKSTIYTNHFPDKQAGYNEGKTYQQTNIDESYNSGTTTKR